MGPTKNMSYRIDKVDHGDTQKFDHWTPEEFVGFLRKAGLGDYREVFLKHKISGRLAPLLTDMNLQEMGITIVGDRLRLKAVINALGKKARYDSRTKVWWEGTERLYYSDIEKLIWTCGGVFPDDPSTYKLTSNHIRIKTVRPARIGPLKLCCCYSYSINNIDLSKVNDVDILGEPAPCCQRTCCCAPGKDHVELMTPTEQPDGKVSLILAQGQGEEVSTMILHQIEEAQMIERD